MAEKNVIEETQVILRVSYKDINSAIRITNFYISHGQAVKMVYRPTDRYKIFTVQ